jgi:hypothetical protein
VIFFYMPNLLGSRRLRRNNRMGHCIATLSSFVVADFVADDAAYGGTADRAKYAAAGKHGAANSANTGADCGVPVLRRHTGTTTQAQQQCCRDHAEPRPLYHLLGAEPFHCHSPVVTGLYRWRYRRPCATNTRFRQLPAAFEQ